MASINLSTLSKHDVQSTLVVFVVHYLNAQASLDSAGNHSVYDQDFIVLPAQKLFDLAGAIDDKAVFSLKSTLVTNDNGEGYLYKMTHRGVELILDDYLIESFAQIVERGEE